MQMIGIHSIEDCLEVLTGLQKHNLEFTIDPSDVTIMNSIARQVFKGTALTDRQYNLMKEKLQKYKEQFESQDVIEFDRAIDRLRNPLREIDRSKYIKIVDTSEVYKNSPYESYKEKWKWLKVRFPFSKKDILGIQHCTLKARRDSYIHEKGSHEHYFLFDEINSYNLVKEFSNKNFTIEQEILDTAKKVEDIHNNKGDYIPSLDNNVVKNLPEKVIKSITDEVGTDITKIVDRHRLYGIVDFPILEGNTLTEKIAYRTTKEFFAKPSEISINNLVEALYNLDRFPILVVLKNDNCYDQIFELYQNLNSFIENKKQVVLFREDGDSEFNKFVKSKELNNWLDKDTEVVYINSNKLPKLCLSTDWRPTACIMFDSFCNNSVSRYIDRCDLIIQREESISPFRRYSSYYG